MKSLKTAAAVLAIVAAVVAFGVFFVHELARPGGRAGPAGVLLAPPAGITPIELGETARRDAAARLQTALAAAPAAEHVAVHFSPGVHEVYWIVDRSAADDPTIEEREAGPGGTRLQTVWHGSVAERLAWAAENGTLDAPGLPRGEQKNLYH